MILASSSKQRIKLMDLLFKDFKNLSVEVDESFSNDFDLYEGIREVAYKKAIAVKDFFDIENDFIVATDTIVSFDNKILLKPKSYDEAFSMIKSYEGKEQEVISGFVFLKIENGKIVFEKKETVISKVKFQDLSDEKVKKWLDLDLYKFCSGGFMIEKVEEDFLIEISGSYSNIIGLPLEILKEKCDYFNIEINDIDVSNIEILKNKMKL
ncbi:MAG: Maf family protein [Lachnospirales bacterium]